MTFLRIYFASALLYSSIMILLVTTFTIGEVGLWREWNGMEWNELDWDGWMDEMKLLSCVLHITLTIASR